MDTWHCTITELARTLHQHLKPQAQLPPTTSAPAVTGPPQPQPAPPAPAPAPGKGPIPWMPHVVQLTTLQSPPWDTAATGGDDDNHIAAEGGLRGVVYAPANPNPSNTNHAIFYLCQVRW